MCVAVRDLYMSWYFLNILLQNTVLNQKYILTKLYVKEKKKTLNSLEFILMVLLHEVVLKPICLKQNIIRPRSFTDH